MKETQFYNLYLTVKGDSKETIIELLKDATNRLDNGRIWRWHHRQRQLFF